MNARMLIPSKYFSPADFEGEPTFVIDRVDFTDLEVEAAKGKPASTERRGVIYLRDISKPWVCNVTNTKCLIAMFGEETGAWSGKRVTVFADRVMSFGEWVPAVRLRGSPDLAAPVNVSLKLRKKREQVMTMKPTGPAPAKPNPPKPAPGPYDEMWRDWKAAGFKDPKEFKVAVREATGKGTGWVAEDVYKFAELLRVMLAGPNGIDAPPPVDEPTPH